MARETLPVEECLRTLGYTLYAKPYAGEAYLAPADSAALAAWLGLEHVALNCTSSDAARLRRCLG